MISFSVFSHLYIGKHFCVLILYPATLLKIFISYTSFLGGFLVSFVHKIIPYSSKNPLIYLFSICPITLSMTSSTVLSRYGKSGLWVCCELPLLCEGVSWGMAVAGGAFGF